MRNKKSNKIYSGLIPFDLKGNQLYYPEPKYFFLSEWDGQTKIGKQSNGEIIDLSKYSDEQLSFRYASEYQYKHADWSIAVDVTEAKPNFIFEDTLVYSNYSRGRSAAYFNFIRESNGKGVTVFLTDLNNMIRQMVNGKITGKFCFCKNGANFGCKLFNE